MNIHFRQAKLEDLHEIVRMLADDFLGSSREKDEDPLPDSYFNALREIDADKNNELIVAVLSESPAVADFLTQQRNEPGDPNTSVFDGSETLALQSETIVGTFQLTFTPSISFQGGKRATIESVRVDKKFRGQGIGREMMLWAIERVREEGCISMQLTTNSDRRDAHRFYESLGFAGSHLGMKLKLK